MEEKILFIDDNENILDSLRRQFRGKFKVETAQSAAQALEKIDLGEEFSVIVSDMKMPGIDGLQLLEQLKQKAPDSMRLMLTGNVDQTTAVQAVNRGNVFRFLNKPIEQVALENAINDALQIFRLRKAESEILNNTLKGTVEILSELLSFVDPSMYGLVKDIRLEIREVSKQLNVQNGWELEVAALLSRVGELALPPEIRLKLKEGKQLSPEEKKIYDRHPEAAYNFLKSIPRLDGVAGMVRYQEKNFDGTGFPEDALKGEEIPVGARVIKVLHEMHVREQAGEETEAIFESLLKQPQCFDPEATNAIKAAFLMKKRSIAKVVIGATAQPADNESVREAYSEPEICKVEELKVGFMAAKEIRAANGVLILAIGNRITEVNLERIKNYHSYTGIKEPLLIRKPLN